MNNEMLTKLKYILTGVASLYIHIYLLYRVFLIMLPPFVWWSYPTFAILLGTFIASIAYVVHKIVDGRGNIL